MQTRLGRGETELADAALEAALAIETPPSDGGTLIEKHFCTAGTRLRQGRRAEALRAADDVIEIVTAKAPTGFIFADFAAGAVEIHLDLLATAEGAEREELERRVRRGCKVLRKLAFTFQGIRPRRWLLVGRLESERGRREKAVAAWRKSEAVAKAMEMEYDLARARVALGGDLGAATETFERLGAIEQLRIAEALS